MPTEHTPDTLSAHYNTLINRHGPSIGALQWHSVFTQHKRYEVLLNNLSKNTHSICDIGCGCGDMYHYITKHKLPLDYTGIDISANMIVAAQRAYPKGRFHCLDITQLLPNHRYDVVIASGIFNNPLKNHLQTVLQTINHMQTLATKQVRINFLSHNTPKKAKTLVYTDPQRIIKGLKLESDQVEIIDGYLGNDVCLFINCLT